MIPQTPKKFKYYELALQKKEKWSPPKSFKRYLEMCLDGVSLIKTCGVSQAFMKLHTTVQSCVTSADALQGQQEHLVCLGSPLRLVNAVSEITDATTRCSEENSILIEFR